GFFELQNFAADVDGNFLRQVAVGHRNGNFGDVAHLGGQVIRHRVDALGEVLPNAAHLTHLRLTAELAFSSYFACDAGHFRSKDAELLDHRVDNRRSFEEFALERAAIDFKADGLEKVALRHGGDRSCHFLRRPQKIIDQGIDREFHLAPGAARQAEFNAVAGAAFAADNLAYTLEFARH